MIEGGILAEGEIECPLNKLTAQGLGRWSSSIAMDETLGPFTDQLLFQSFCLSVGDSH